MNGRLLRCDTKGRDSVVFLLKASGTELFESADFYSEDGLEMAVYQWCWGRLCRLIVEVS